MESGRAWQPAGRSFRDGGGGRVYIIIARLGANQASTYLDSLLSALKLFGVNHGKFFPLRHAERQAASGTWRIFLWHA